jgi:hypothetical protein
MLDIGRKHGPFDFRYPVRRKLADYVWELQPQRDRPERLEWSVFVARFFPNRRRHDSEALAAYEAYRNALDRAASPERSPTGQPALARGTRVRRADRPRLRPRRGPASPSLQRAPASVPLERGR